MKTIALSLIATVAFAITGNACAQTVPNPADKPKIGKPVAACYKHGKLKKNRVIWNGRCYVKPDCGDGYYYGPSLGSCVQNNGGGE